MDIQLLLYIHEDQCMQVSKWGNSLAIRLPADFVFGREQANERAKNVR